MEELLEEIAMQYEVSKSKVKLIYDWLLQIPFVDEDEKLLECVVLIVDNLRDKEYEEYSDLESRHTEYAISDALFRVYEDKSLSYLAPSYIRINSSRYQLK